MKRLCPLKPHVKKGSVKDHHLQSLPQYTGVPGWLLLTHNDERPVALFADNADRVEEIPIIMDERVFSDTVLRVVRLSKSIFIAYDIRYLNGKNLQETLPFKERYEKLIQILDLFHVSDLTAVVTCEDAPVGTLIRGYEHYDDQPGTMGVFLPVDE